MAKRKKWGAGPKRAPGRAVLARILLALSIGAAGGALFDYLGFPLPWMLGPVIFNVLASMVRAPIAGPERVRPFVQIVIGVMLGSSFSPAILGQLAGWLASLSLFAAYLLLVALVVIPYYRRIGGLDPVTSYFAAMPGGLVDMTFIGRDMGGDDRAIVLAHTSRIVLVVIIVAVVSRILPDYDATMRQGPGVPWSAIPISELAILAVGGVAGLFLGRRLGLPAPQLLGPMLVSAALHLTEVATLPPPREIIIVAQIVLGTTVGCRFVGTQPGVILRALLLGTGATVIMLAMTAFFAFALHGLVGQSSIQILLAYAPGGLAEMSLIAIAMGVDVTFVAVHHLVRISLVLLTAPLVFGRLRRRGAAED